MLFNIRYITQCIHSYTSKREELSNVWSGTKNKRSRNSVIKRKENLDWLSFWFHNSRKKNMTNLTNFISKGCAVRCERFQEKGRDFQGQCHASLAQAFLFYSDALDLKDHSKSVFWLSEVRKNDKAWEWKINQEKDRL